MHYAWTFAFFIVVHLVSLIEGGCEKSFEYHSGRCIIERNRENVQVNPWVNREGTYIRLKIPFNVNETQDSTVYIIVLGSPACSGGQVSEYLRKIINVTNSQEGWIAANFTGSDSIPEEYFIGKNSTDNGSRNCPLHRNQTYRVVVVIDPYNEGNIKVIISLPIFIHPTTDEGLSELQLSCLSILPAMGICLLLIYVLLRRYEEIYARVKTLRSLITNNQSIDVPLDCHSHSVEIEEFEDYVKRAIETGELETQFKMLPTGMVRPCLCGSLPNNISKNRDRTLIAYDETRVILSKSSLRYQSDYINANYIQGYCKEKAYIATQGPMSDTVVDFWKMIWQEEVRIICMMVNVMEGGKETCAQYWPEVGKTSKYEDIVVLNAKQTLNFDYIHRIFQLTPCSATKSRKVHHLQYTAWPEEGEPTYSHSIVEYLNELRAIAPGPGPVVVHCSTGTGRTGTIILSDIALRHAAAEGVVDVLTEAKNMYSARANMLDNPQQYLLAHLLPTQCLCQNSSKLHCSDVTPQKIAKLKEHLPTHMERLAASSWMDRALHPHEPLRLSIQNHMANNRFRRPIPVEQSLTTLKRYPPDHRGSDYISAVSVDGLRIKKQYIASQLPSPTTILDFWKLITENEVELVVILQRPGPEDPSCVDVIPSEGISSIPVPHLKVEHEASFNYSQHFTTDQLSLTDTSTGRARLQTVTVLSCNNWNLTDDVEPPPPEALVALWSVSEGITRRERPTLVLCRDGVTGCGLYLALSFLLERMAVEQECDVILAVRAIRRSRPEFVISEEQFEYLYDAAVKFLEGFETYANFS